MEISEISTLFHPLSQYEVKNIVQMQLGKVRARFLEQRKIKVDFTPSAVEYIEKVSYDRAFGARLSDTLKRRLLKSWQRCFKSSIIQMFRLIAMEIS